jgi:hypothetical protein
LIDKTDPNQANGAIFAIFRTGVEKTIPVWILALFAVIICIVNQCAIGAFQNAIQNVIVSVPNCGWEIELPLLATKAFSWLLNIPIIIVGCFGVNIMKFFMLSHIITVSSLMPLMMGFMPIFDYVLTGTSCLLGSISAILSVSIFGIIDKGFQDGIGFYFFTTVYDYRPFTIAFTVSIFSSLFFGIIETIVMKSADIDHQPLHLHPSLRRKRYIDVEDDEDLDDQYGVNNAFFSFQRIRSMGSSIVNGSRRGRVGRGNHQNSRI